MRGTTYLYKKLVTIGLKELSKNISNQSSASTVHYVVIE